MLRTRGTRHVTCRIALANLWCGIEALFGDKKDRPVTRRIVEKICKWLPALKETEVENAYNIRCDAVHGRRFAGPVNKAITYSSELLRQAILRWIETDSVPLPDWTP